MWGQDEYSEQVYNVLPELYFIIYIIPSAFVGRDPTKCQEFLSPIDFKKELAILKLYPIEISRL